MGARGNSGVILSQIWRGLAQGLAEKEALTGSDLAGALKQSSTMAYNGLSNPVEGTILTVIREAASAAQTQASSGGNDLISIMEAAVDAASEAVANTPSLLPVLKEAGVVDAGGQGLYTILEGTLHYLKGEAAEKVPVWRMLSESAGALELRARRWAGTLGQGCSVVSGRSAIGGGSLPGESLPTSLLSLDAGDAPGGATGLAAALRAGEPPVIARIDNERVVLDPRTVLPDEEEPLLRIVASALKQSTIERAESGE